MAGRTENLKPFQKGHDPRRNTKGRPKTADDLKGLLLSLLHEDAIDKNGNVIVINGKKVSMAEALMRKWITSNNPKLQMEAMNRAFGKVKDTVELGGPDGGPVLIQMTWGDIDAGDGGNGDAA